VEHWTEKFKANTERDVRKLAALESAGWRVIVVWECDLRRAAEESLERLCAEIVSPPVPESVTISSFSTEGTRP
jgi:DNA mismatch endonuclease (patch repair protein)